MGVKLPVCQVFEQNDRSEFCSIPQNRKCVEGNSMKYPICAQEMTEGDIVCKAGAGPTLYPRKAEESE